MTSLDAVQAAQLFRLAPQRHLDVGEGELAHRCIGQGPDLLFVHGWPVSGATFRGLLPHLAPHFTCHVIDLVGAGDSRFDRNTTITVTQHIESLRRVVDLLGLERFAAVGHDSGGMMARHAFAGDPRLRAMGLVDTEQPQGLHWRFKQFLLMAKLPGFGKILSWAAMRPRLRRNPFLLGDCFTDRSLLDGEFEEFFLAPLSEDPMRQWAAETLARSLEERFVFALEGLHADIDVPVQLVWGEDDPFFPLDWTREMVGDFADARLHVVRGAKLFVHEERPREVAEAMLPTLLGAFADDQRSAAE